MSASAAAAAKAADEPKSEEAKQSKYEAKFASLKPLFYRPGGFAPPVFEPGYGTLKMVTQETRILVVGAGGLGCEILKDLALSGFTDITVIDLDTIDVSNLNRQFLFRQKDVGQPKAKVAAEFIMRRCKGVKVDYKTIKLQEFSSKFYSKFNIVIAGLDNVEARSWLNEKLCDLVRYDKDGEVDWNTVAPMIDGGTTGFMGQSRLFVPHYTSCFECQTHTLEEGQAVHAHLCTIADVPRIPEHCIQYALLMQWPYLVELKTVDNFKLAERPKEKEGEKLPEPPNAVKLDKDDILHMSWIFRRAEERAKQFNINGVTFHLTQQVVKNIIPAIASTNALISASCVTEALKFRSLASYRLNNYMMYMGDVGTNSETFQHVRLPNCKACHKPVLLTLNADTATLAELAAAVIKGCSEMKITLDKPNIVRHGLSLYNTALDDPNERGKKTLAGDIGIEHNEMLIVFDKQSKTQKVIVRFEGQFTE